MANYFLLILLYSRSLLTQLNYASSAGQHHLIDHVILHLAGSVLIPVHLHAFWCHSNLNRWFEQILQWKFHQIIVGSLLDESSPPISTTCRNPHENLGLPHPPNSDLSYIHHFTVLLSSRSSAWILQQLLYDSSTQRNGWHTSQGTTELAHSCAPDQDVEWAKHMSWYNVGMVFFSLFDFLSLSLLSSFSSTSDHPNHEVSFPHGVGGTCKRMAENDRKWQSTLVNHLHKSILRFPGPWAPFILREFQRCFF